MHGVSCGAMGEWDDGDVCRLWKEEVGGDEEHRVVARDCGMEGRHGGLQAVEAGDTVVDVAEGPGPQRAPLSLPIRLSHPSPRHLLHQQQSSLPCPLCLGQRRLRLRTSRTPSHVSIPPQPTSPPSQSLSLSPTIAYLYGPRVCISVQESRGETDVEGG